MATRERCRAVWAQTEESKRKRKRMVGMDTQKPGSESGFGIHEETVALASIYCSAAVY